MEYKEIFKSMTSQFHIYYINRPSNSTYSLGHLIIKSARQIFSFQPIRLLVLIFLNLRFGTSFDFIIKNWIL